jgi:hypothetical protein
VLFPPPKRIYYGRVYQLIQHEGQMLCYDFDYDPGMVSLGQENQTIS